jgi:hypothetical protein
MRFHSTVIFPSLLAILLLPAKFAAAQATSHSAGWPTFPPRATMKWVAGFYKRRCHGLAAAHMIASRQTRQTSYSC